MVVVGHPATVRSFCRLCIGLCGIEVEAGDEGVVAVRGDAEQPISLGYTCSKGRALAELHAAPERLDGPMMRVDGHLVPTTWDTALTDIDARIADIVAESGPGAIGLFMGGGMYMDAAGYWASRRLQRRVDSRNLYSDMTIDSAAKYRVGELMAGTYSLVPHADPDARLLLLFGTNPVVSHGQTPMFQNPVERLRSSRRRGPVWVVDPRTTETARLADRHLAIRPGTDFALLAWLVRSILERQDEKARRVLRARATHLDELRTAVAPFTVEHSARITGLTESDLVELVDAIRDAGRVAILTGTGVTMSQGGNAAEWLVWALLLATDSFDRPGGMWCNPGYLARLDERDALPAAGPPQPGTPTHPEVARLMGEYPAAAIPDEIDAGNLRALVVLGGNLAIALADTERVRRALGQLDVMVALDVSRTATTELATHVLACHAQLERADVALLSDLFNPLVAMQYTPPVVPAHPGRRSAWWLVARIASSLGVDIFPPGFDPDGATDDDVLSLVTGPDLLETLRSADRPWVVAPPPRYGWVDQRLPIGRWDIAPGALVEHLRTLIEHLRTMGEPSGLILIPRRQPRRLNGTTVRGGDAPEILLHPTDAEAAGVVDGGVVDVTSATGSLRLRAHVTDATRVGAASIPHGWPECNVNRLISGHDLDPLTGMPRQSGTPIEVRPVVARSPQAG